MKEAQESKDPDKIAAALDESHQQISPAKHITHSVKKKPVPVIEHGHVVKGSPRGTIIGKLDPKAGKDLEMLGV